MPNMPWFLVLSCRGSAAVFCLTSSKTESFVLESRELHHYGSVDEETLLEAEHHFHSHARWRVAKLMFTFSVCHQNTLCVSLRHIKHAECINMNMNNMSGNNTSYKLSKEMCQHLPSLFWSVSRVWLHCATGWYFLIQMDWRIFEDSGIQSNSGECCKKKQRTALQLTARSTTSVSIQPVQGHWPTLPMPGIRPWCIQISLDLTCSGV